MQHVGNFDLQAAIDGSDRRWRLEVLFDWNRNGLFSHTYSDLSAMLVGATRQGVITSDLPSKVNTISGAASSDVRLTLQGNRAATELDAFALFGEYRNDSPLYGIQIEGVKVRYTRVEITRAGPIRTRQFTGRVRSLSLSQNNAQVNLICQDNMEVVAAPVTLPLWAVGYNTPIVESPGIAPGTDRGVDATWVVEEVCRQIGYHTGPLPRPGCISYLTCNGSFLPSMGYGTLVNAVNVTKYSQFITQEIPDPWEQGLYGLAPRRIPSVDLSPAPPKTRNVANWNSQNYVYVPQDGSQHPNINLLFSGWVKFDGPAAKTGVLQNCYYLDDALNIDGIAIGDLNWGSAQAYCYENGFIGLYVRESSSLPSPRFWFAEWGDATLTGWHYVSGLFKFRPTDVTFELWVDGVQKAPTSNDALTGVGFRHGPVPRITMNNPIKMQTTIPAQHLQWSVGDATLAAYVANEQLPVGTDDGLPKAVVSRSSLELDWIPDINGDMGWAVLNELANAEFGTTFFNEFGQLYWMSHAALRTATAAQIANAPVMTTDHMSQFTFSPSLDQHRNSVSVGWSRRFIEQAIVWKASTAREHFASLADEVHNEEVALQEVVAVYWSMTPFATFDPLPDAEIRIDISQAASTQFLNPALDAPPGWDAFVIPRPDQRTMGKRWQIAGAGVDLYVGAFKDANQAAWFVAGRRYTQADTFRKLVINDTALAADGGILRTISINDSPWIQTEAMAERVANALLDDVVNPVPAIENVQIKADQRLQYTDVVAFTNSRVSSGRFWVQVLGRAWSDSTAGVRDDLTVRVIRRPNHWILGHSTLSVLGSTTDI